MKDKTLFRWITLQQSDDLKQFCNEAREKKQFQETIKKFEGLLVNKNAIKKKSGKSIIKELKLPAEFEYLVHKNIIIKARYKDTDDNVDNKYNIIVNCSLNFINFDNDLRESIEKEYSLLVKENNKKAIFECIIAELRRTLINHLLKVSWKIIETYFPLTEYGFPSENLIISIMNNILNGELCFVQAEPKVVRGSSYDLIYIEKLRKENESLKKYIKDNINNRISSIDINVLQQNDLNNISDNISLSEVANMMIETIDEDINMCALIEIINKNPKYYIEINSYIVAQEIKDKSSDLIDAIERFRKKEFGSIDNLASSYKKIMKDSILYASKRFNYPYMNGWEIADAISLDRKRLGDNEPKTDYEKCLAELNNDGGLESSNIDRDIEKLCEQTGLVELNKDILKNNKKYKENEKSKNKFFNDFD